MVQITKDPTHQRGHAHTLISLPGRHIVLMPALGARGVAQVEADAERARLKQDCGSWRFPRLRRHRAHGRTGMLKTMISKDLKISCACGKPCKGKVMRETPTALLYKESALVIRSIAIPSVRRFFGILIG